MWTWKGPVVESRECSPEKGLLWRGESVALERTCCGDDGVWPRKGPVVEKRKKILLLLLVVVVVVVLLLCRWSGKFLFLPWSCSLGL